MTSSNSQRRNARKMRNSKYLHVWESLYHASFHVSFSGMKLCDNNKDLPLSTDVQWSDDRHGTNWILPPREQYFIFPRLPEGSFLYSWYSEMLHLFDSIWFFFHSFCQCRLNIVYLNLGKLDHFLFYCSSIILYSLLLQRENVLI